MEHSKVMTRAINFKMQQQSADREIPSLAKSVVKIVSLTETQSVHRHNGAW